MTVVNGLAQKRLGLITRERTTRYGTEQSVIDFVITSGDLLEHIEYVHIDDKRVHVLTKLWKTRNGKHSKVESNHNIIQTKINVPWIMKGNELIEVFNFKSEASQKAFYKATQDTNELEKYFKLISLYGLKQRSSCRD